MRTITDRVHRAHSVISIRCAVVRVRCIYILSIRKPSNAASQRPATDRMGCGRFGVLHMHTLYHIYVYLNMNGRCDQTAQQFLSILMTSTMTRRCRNSTLSGTGTYIVHRTHTRVPSAIRWMVRLLHTRIIRSHPTGRSLRLPLAAIIGLGLNCRT